MISGIAGQASIFMRTFDVRDYSIDAHIGFLAIEPRIYAAASVLREGTNADQPTIHGFRYGLEKLVDSDRNFSLQPGLYLYPNVAFGVTIAPLGQPLFLDVLGDRAHNRTSAPVGFNHQRAYVGLGIRC